MCENAPHRAHTRRRRLWSVRSRGLATRAAPPALRVSSRRRRSHPLALVPRCARPLAHPSFAPLSARHRAFVARGKSTSRHRGRARGRARATRAATRPGPTASSTRSPASAPSRPPRKRSRWCLQTMQTMIRAPRRAPWRDGGAPCASDEPSKSQSLKVHPHEIRCPPSPSSSPPPPCFRRNLFNPRRRRSAAAPPRARRPPTECDGAP